MSSRCLQVLNVLIVLLVAFARADTDVHLEEKVRETERKLSQATRKEEGILRELEEIDRALERMKEELDLRNARAERAQQRIEELRGNITLLSIEEESLREKAKARLRAIYKFGYNGLRQGYASALISSGSVVDMLVKAKYLAAVIRADQDMLERLSDKIEELEKKRDDLESEKRDYDEAKRAIIERMAKIAESKSQREELLRKYREEKETYQKTMAQLKKSIKEIDSLVDDLSGKDRGVTDMPQLNLKDLGTLSLPVAGTIIENSTEEFKGITIQAPEGTPVRSIYSGVVEYAKWFDGLGIGQMVVINHGHGYRSLYAHLSEILVKEGDNVEKDEVIGKVGKTGSLTGPALYFEIRHELIPLDIRRWMR